MSLLSKNVLKICATQIFLCSALFGETTYSYNLRDSAAALNWGDASTWTPAADAPLEVPDGNTSRVYLQKKEVLLMLDKDRTITYMATGGNGMVLDLMSNKLTIDAANMSGYALWFNNAGIKSDSETIIQGGTFALTNTSSNTDAHLSLGANAASTGRTILTFAEDTRLEFYNKTPNLRYRYDADSASYNGKNGAVFNLLGYTTTDPSNSGTYSNLRIGTTSGYINEEYYDTSLVTVNIGSESVKTSKAELGGITQYGATTLNVYGSIVLNGAYSAAENSTNSLAKTEFNIYNGAVATFKNNAFNANGGKLFVQSGGKIQALDSGLKISNTDVVINGNVEVADGTTNSFIQFTNSTVLLDGEGATVKYTNVGGNSGLYSGTVMTISNGAKLDSLNGFIVTDSVLRLNTQGAISCEWLNFGNNGTIEFNVENVAQCHFQVWGTNTKAVFNASQDFSKYSYIFRNGYSNSEIRHTVNIVLGDNVEYIKGRSLTEFGLAEGYGLTIENFANDVFLFSNWNENDDLSFVDLGDDWVDLHTDTIVVDGQTYTTLRANYIPEPSLFGGFFGLAAAAFYIYHKSRK